MKSGCGCGWAWCECDEKPDEMLALARYAALNPKDQAAIAEDRDPLDLLEHAAEVAIARALKAGADKYGRRNFRVAPVKASIYGAAMRRHVGAWLNGEEDDPETGVSHLAHAAATVHVLLSAMEAGTFIDDREPKVKWPELDG